VISPVTDLHRRGIAPQPPRIGWFCGTASPLQQTGRRVGLPLYLSNQNIDGPPNRPNNYMAQFSLMLAILDLICPRRSFCKCGNPRAKFSLNSTIQPDAQEKP
jgi:hypothetical protein